VYLLRLLLLTPLLAGALPLTAAAQSGTGNDPQLVVARSVQPRVAYRALAEPTDNPVAAQAPLFPAAAFGRAIDGSAGQRVDDEVLRALGAGGLDGAGGARAVSFMPDTLGLGPTAQGAAPAGLSGPAGAIGHATSGLGGLVTSTLAQALGGIGGHP